LFVQVLGLFKIITALNTNHDENKYKIMRMNTYILITMSLCRIKVPFEQKKKEGKKKKKKLWSTAEYIIVITRFITFK